MMVCDQVLLKAHLYSGLNLCKNVGARIQKIGHQQVKFGIWCMNGIKFVKRSGMTLLEFCNKYKMHKYIVSNLQLLTKQKDTLELFTPVAFFHILQMR